MKNNIKIEKDYLTIRYNYFIDGIKERKKKKITKNKNHQKK